MLKLANTLSKRSVFSEKGISSATSDQLISQEDINLPLNVSTFADDSDPFTADVFVTWIRSQVNSEWQLSSLGLVVDYFVGAFFLDDAVQFGFLIFFHQRRG